MKEWRNEGINPSWKWRNESFILGGAVWRYHLDRTQKTLKTIGKTTFWSIRKCLWKYLIKPVENEDFLSRNRKMASGMIKKHYKIRVSRRVFKTSQNAVTSPEFADFQSAKTRRGNAYKTLLKLIISEPFPEKGLQNHQKALPKQGFRNAIFKTS